MTYHEDAQKFIKSSKAKGYTVKAEDGELIAYPPGTPNPSPSLADKIKNGIKYVGKIFTDGVAKEKAIQQTDDNKARNAGERLQAAGQEEYKPLKTKGRSTSTGYMVR